MEQEKKPRYKVARGTYAVTENDAAIVAEYLRKRGAPVPLKDIVAATGSFIKFHPTVPTTQIMNMIGMDERIVKVGFGSYAYKAPAAKTSTLAVTWQENPAEIQKPDEMKKLKYNEEVDGIVTAIHPYGAFVQLVDYDLSGLIHVSRVKRGKYYFTQEDLEQHFRVGDKVRVKVQELREGKLALSTFDLPLPDYSNTALADQLKPVKAAIKAPAPAPVPSKAAAPVNIHADTPYMHMADKRELETLYDMVKNKVGVISEAAKAEIREQVMRQGMVKITMSIITTNDYQADVSLAFVKHIAKANGGL